MYDVLDIAKWFLSKESMTHKKLQKLCYYAQAWFCTLYNDGPLFHNRVEAWVHGPVIPDLYPHYADYRWNPIPQEEAAPFCFGENVIRVLESVYDTYGEYDGDQLERLTHSEAPWKQARGTLELWEISHNEISTQSMRDYYGEKYKEEQND